MSTPTGTHGPRDPEPNWGRVAFAAACAGYAVLVLWQAFTLPGTVPQHIGPGGTITWGTRTGHVVVATLSGLLMVLVFGLLPGVVHRLPAGLLNLPHKEYWLEPENRPRFQRMLAADMGWLGAILVTYLGFVMGQVGSLAAGAPYSEGPFWVVTGVVLALVTGLSMWMSVGPRWRPPVRR